MQESVFITGASGFLGGALIARLLERNLRVRCLVRASSAEQGLVRLRDGLSRYGLREDRLTAIGASDIVCGDLVEPERWLGDPRVRAATRIVNCGASTAFGQDSLAWAVNYEGTLAFARAAATFPDLQRFLHVGTAMSCGPGQPRLVSEAFASRPSDEHYVGYTASKARFEEDVVESVPTLPLVVARPSIVLGHTELGCAPSASIYWILRMARAIGGFSCDLDDTIDIVPVDWAALALERLLFAEQLRHRTYHLSAGSVSRIAYREIDVAFARADGTEPVAHLYRRLAPEDLPRESRVATGELGRAQARLAGMALSLYGAFAELAYTFDNARILAEGVPPPPRLVDYFDRCVETARSIPLAAQISRDVKLQGVSAAPAGVLAAA